MRQRLVVGTAPAGPGGSLKQGMRYALTSPQAGALILSALLALAPASPATAQTTLLEHDAASLSLGGYVRGISVLHDRGYELPSLPGMDTPARRGGSYGQVVRLKLLLEGDAWRVELHDRIQARLTSDAAGTQTLGFGVGAEPERLVNLRSDLVQRDRLTAWHDVDRLTFSLHTEPVDLTLGRQAITWGTSSIFPVADLWAAFSPFEQDTEEKPGIDAVRALIYPTGNVTLDAVIAYRGGMDNLSAGLRATANLPDADVWAGAGKFWRQIMAMGGVTLMGDKTRWHAEVVLPWDMDDDSLQRPRLTIGADRLGADRFIGVEYHHNGIGAASPDRYMAAAADPRLARGESYHLGRHYLGAVAGWSPDVQNRLNLGLNAMANLGDRSTALIPNATYDLGQATRLSAGALLSIGSKPDITTAPPFLRPVSEFGLYGNAFFGMVSVFF